MKGLINIIRRGGGGGGGMDFLSFHKTASTLHNVCDNILQKLRYFILLSTSTANNIHNVNTTLASLCTTVIL